MDKKTLKVLTFGVIGGFAFGGYCTLKACLKIKQIRQGFVNAIADKFIDVIYDEKPQRGKVSYSRFSETRR